MFVFAYPGLLFLLLLIPFIAFLFLVSRYVRKRRLEKFGNPAILKNLMPGFSSGKSLMRLIIALTGLAAIIFALARPWGGVKDNFTSREGIEIVIAVDASNSMLASSTGDENGPDRMRTAKLMLEKLINRLGNDRVGLIAYAGDAYTLIPVTNDYVSAKAFLNSIEPSMFTHQGTNIGAAISMASNSFSGNKNVGKAIILLTDAEELENVEGTLQQVSQAAKSGIQTDVIGIGSTPVTIPDADRGRMVDDETGTVVHTSLNEDLALEIAKTGKGIYVNASNDEAIDELMKQLGTLKKASLESSFMVSHYELYYPFVILALLMILIDFIMTDKKNRWLEKITFFHKNKTLLFLAVMITLVSCGNDKTREAVKKEGDSKENADSLRMIYSMEKERDFILNGNQNYMAGNFEKADSNYIAALTVNPYSVVASLNTGVNTVRTLMVATLDNDEATQLSDSITENLLNKAKDSFAKASQPKIEKGNVSSLAFYNLGNIQFIQDDYQNAIDAYKEALRLNPSDEHARRNLRIAQLQKKDDNQNSQNDQQDNESQDDQNENPQQDRQQMNEQTSEQILQAAERKENMKRSQMQKQNEEGTVMGGRSSKKW